MYVYAYMYVLSQELEKNTDRPDGPVRFELYMFCQMFKDPASQTTCAKYFWYYLVELISGPPCGV